MIGRRWRSFVHFSVLLGWAGIANAGLTGFNVVEPDANPLLGNIHTKVAGQDFALDIIALDTNLVLTAFNGTVAVEAVDSSGGGACASLPVIATFSQQTFSLLELGRHRLTAPNTVTDAYPNARIRVKYPASAPDVISCSTDAFAIRPASLSFAVTAASRTSAGAAYALDNTAVSGATVHNAGRPFRIVATAYTGAATPAVATNYSGAPSAVLSSCAGTACTTTTGTLSTGTWSGAGGTVSTTTATYDDVGAFHLQLQDTAFAAIDASDGTPLAQRTISSTPLAVGRFVPDRFVLSATAITPRSALAGCAGSTFTYMGERLSATFTLTAVRYPSGTTTRYSGTLGRLVLAAPASFAFGAIDGATVLGARLDTTGGASGTWSNGTAVVTALLSLSRNGAPDGPYHNVRLGIAPVDPDGVALDTDALNLDADANGAAERAQIGTATGLRFGRLRLQNALGSPLIAVPVPMEVQFWNGSAFVTNTADHCTSIGTANVALGNYQKNLVAGQTGVSVGGAFSAGVGTLRLIAPGAGRHGSVDVSVNLSGNAAGASCSAGMAATSALARPYLQGAWCGSAQNRDPTARVTFGLPRSPDRVVFRRENF